MYRHAHSWLDGPSEPGSTPEDCRELTNKHIGGKKHLELKEVAAAKLAIEAIEKRKTRHVFWAGSRSGQAVLSPRDKISLPVRVFHQLDRELFRGVLRGQVCLTGSTTLSPAVHGATRRAGHPYGRVTILLNPEMVITERVEVILATLIHHMAHAYFLVCCGYGAGQDQHDLKHGLPMSALLWSIKGIFLPCSPSFPSLFHCTGDLRSHPAPSSIGQHGMEGQSNCSWHCNDYKPLNDCYRYLLDTLRPHKAEIKKQDDDEGTFEVEKEYPRYQYLHLYQPGTGALDPIPRAQFELHNPSCSFVEFHYQGRAIPLDVSNWPKFRAHLAKNDPNVVKVPKDISTKTLQSILQFATRGTYEPTWQPGTYTLKGPPKIDTGSGNVSETGPFAPTEDVRVYAAAQTIGFEELRQHALQRLYAQTLLKGDAMDFVEEVYSGKEPGKDKPVACGKGWKPDKDLREFVAAFLAAEHPDRKRIEVEIDEYGVPTRPIGGPPVMNLGGFFGGGGGGPGSVAKQTNLGVLQGVKWKERLAKLRSGGGAFLEDLDNVEDSLKTGTRVEPPAFVRSWVPLSWGGGAWGGGGGAPLLLNGAGGLRVPGGFLESATVPVPISPGYGYRAVVPPAARAPPAVVYYPGSWVRMGGAAPGVGLGADAGVMFNDRRGIFVNAHPPAAAGGAGGGRGGYYGVGELVDEFEQVRPFRGW